jgi:hypothetical protein
MRKGKTDKVLNKNKPTSETEEDWNLGEGDGRSYESDVDKSIQNFFLSLTMIPKLMFGFNSIEIKRKKEKKGCLEKEKERERKKVK